MLNTGKNEVFCMTASNEEQRGLCRVNISTPFLLLALTKVLQAQQEFDLSIGELMVSFTFDS